MSQEIMRVAILGAGPVGLEAAHALIAAGRDVQVYEKGRVGESIRGWGHIKLFSPWSLNTSARGLALLAEVDAPRPDPEVFPTGRDYVERYLEPLARHPKLEGRVHTRSTVVQIGRQGVLKGELIASAARREHPFRILLEDERGRERVALADVVIDATGCWGNPNSLGTGGIPALGERKAAFEGRVLYHIPDCQGGDRAAFEDKHTVVVGAGYSAITTLNALYQLKLESPGTRITWVTRSSGAPYQRIENDPLPERDWLSLLGNALASGERGDAAVCIPSAQVVGVESEGEQVSLKLVGHEGREQSIGGVDTVVANVGFHPDLSLFRELQVHQCYASEGPMKLAAALLSASGGGGDCLAQTSMGAATLKSPEPDFYVLGAKSYGRNSAFLIKLGLEQIEDLKTLLA